MAAETDLSYKEISSKLHVSVSAIRQTANIVYKFFGVHTRLALSHAWIKSDMATRTWEGYMVWHWRNEELAKAKV
jgi:hypothetical protein